jgi:DNA replication protein DnaC
MILLRHQGSGRDQRAVRLIAARYERRSLLITANQPFGDWGKVFPDPAMTVAAIDRLVHHATIFEMNVESYRRRTASHARRRPTVSPTTIPPDQSHPL